jgi:transposase
MNASVVYVGVDVAKAFLDVAWNKQTCRFANEKKGHEALVAWVKQSGAAVQLICEASGGYERDLLESLAQSNVAVSLVQANRVRQYARAAGILAKTDTVDAAVLAAFGAALRPKPLVPPSAVQKQLREYDTQRRHLNGMLVAEQNRLAQLAYRELRSLSRSLIAKIKQQMSALDARISSVIRQNEELRLKAQKLVSITGVGSRTAALVLAQIPELGQLNRRQTAALSGLAPFNRDSGTLRGKRTIFGGRRALRSGLYMAALTAARRNQILAPFYQRLRASGKPHKVALTAVMRKLLIALNKTLKPDTATA